MVSSLAEQLARSASFGSNLLNEKARKQAASESYLFTSKEARQHDIESLHALGLNGFLQLKSLQPSVARFEDELFSEFAISLDRTLQPAEENAQLDASMNEFIPLLGPFLLDAPTGKVLEWLVRRFRIHEFNVPSVVSVFLPYHETPHFTKMVSILHIPDNSPIRFLQAYKTAAKPLHRPLLINDMVTKPEVVHFTAGILPVVLKDHSSGMHRALIAFHTGSLLEYIAKAKTLDENTMTVLLPAAVDPLQIASGTEQVVRPAVMQEVVLGSYLVLAALSQKTRLIPKAVKTLLTTVCDCSERVSGKHLIRTLVSFCAPQEMLENIPSGVVDVLLEVQNIDAEIVGAMSWAGSEKFLIPLINSFITRLPDEPVYEILDAVVTSSGLISEVTGSISTMLIHTLVNDTPEDDTAVLYKRLLAQLNQRHPKAVQSSSKTIIDDDETKREAMELLLTSLAVHSVVAGPSVSDAELSTLIVGSAHADSNVRSKSVRDLVQRLADDQVADSEGNSVSSTLLLRVHDTSATVLQALYSTSADVVTKVFLSSSEPNAYIDALKQALHSPSAKLSRDVVRAHLNFLLKHFLPNASSLEEGGGEDIESEETRERSQKVFMDIIFPFLLFSKPRAKTAVAAWEILYTPESEVNAEFELFDGCVDALNWEKAKTRAGDKYGVDPAAMSKINVAVAAKIADNVLASNYFQAQFTLLLRKLGEENSHGRAMGYLVVRALLSRLSGEQRIEAGHQLLDAMQLKTFEHMGDFMQGVEDIAGFLDDDSVGDAVVLKPNSRSTLRRLQLSVLSALPSFPRPSGASTQYIADTGAESEALTPETARAARYVELLRSVYALSNSSASLPLLSTFLLRKLFINLGDDALAFLAGTWLLPLTESHVQYAALRHACAFLEAHVVTCRTLDFQTIIPALLVALQSRNAAVRDAAARCLSVVSKLATAPAAENVYAYDAIYGPRSAQLQYLDWTDVQKYLVALAEIRDPIVHDAEYLQAFHHEHLAQRKGDPKKLAGYKERILCYLLAHVNGCSLRSVKVALLNLVNGVSSPAKAQVLAPTIDDVFGHEFTTLEESRNLLSLVVSVFDVSSAANLNDSDKSLWGVYERLLTMVIKSDKWQQARDGMLRHLQRGLFAKLSVERKLQLCRTLIRFTTEEESTASTTKTVLTNVLDDTAIITRLLVDLQPQASATDPSAQPASKRPRVEKTATTFAHGSLSSLAIIAEILDSSKITGTLELLSCLLETLNKVVSNVSPDLPDRRYVEQLLMSAAENVAQRFTPSASVPANSVRVDTLIDILRTSENPQTFHQACLLMASLARISPDTVLHNVMPVFTFMGSNVFHRDDAYSFRVVQKTIESIVPVMVASLKTNHGSGIQLYSAAREFLRVFTNAANHVPRHRRVNFFSQFVDTLGPADFLAPVTMLLVDRVANRVVRQSAADVVGSFFLPLAIYERYEAGLQLQALLELVREVEKQDRRDDPSVHPFLGSLPDEEQAQTDLTSKRRSVALLMFCEHALKRLRRPSALPSSEERAAAQELLKSLLDISSAKPNDTVYAEVASAARTAVTSTLGTMFATDFVAGILTVLDSRSSHAQTGAFELLSVRLGEIADNRRKEIASSIVQIVQAACRVLALAAEDSLAGSTLKALKAVCDTLSPGEESAVTTSVPLVLAAAKRSGLRVLALQTMSAFAFKLGARLIPHLKEIVRACIELCKTAISASSELDVIPLALGALRNLLTSIPTFWGKDEILQVVGLYLDSSTAAGPHTSDLTLLVRTTAKRASPGVLLPALCGLWSSVATSTKDRSPQALAYLQVLKISLKAASRTAVLEHLRELFKTLLYVFDFCAEQQDSEVERALSGAWMELIVKLNETAFRPIFRKLFDWSFGGDASDGRKVVFCHVYSAMIDFFKGLMVPYMSFAWPTFLDLLRTYATNIPEDGHLWLGVVQTVTKSLLADEDRVFWRNDKLRQLVPLAVQQVPVAVQVPLPSAKDALAACLAALLGTVDDDVLVKTLNLDVLMHSRAEDARVRLFSLACAEQLWRAQGEKLFGFVTETATFVAEAAEDENDRVVQEAHKLKAAVEAMGGSIE
ncbi:armadillo-type protein [Epithele typhae]|uniref:armadillo-type protein n=1 Tax=Epithele typhae TaxID=378194 RepID=UPI002007C80A|nr:armadillo-type protein [Epithele typhae]KAH9920883.1 armadillo-type protein [Epithele typhae]